MTQTHGLTLWTEPAGSGGAPGVVAVYFVKSGSDWTFSTTGPEQGAFIDVENNESYVLIDLTPVYLVADGGDFSVDQVGPAAAIFVDDGSGDPMFSTDLTLTPIADLFFDPSGDLWLVRRTAERLHAVQVRGDVQLY